MLSARQPLTTDTHTAMVWMVNTFHANGGKRNNKLGVERNTEADETVQNVDEMLSASDHAEPFKWRESTGACFSNFPRYTLHGLRQ